jgi:hypothetical protein
MHDSNKLVKLILKFQELLSIIGAILVPDHFNNLKSDSEYGIKNLEILCIMFTICYYTVLTDLIVYWTKEYNKYHQFFIACLFFSCSRYIGLLFLLIFPSDRIKSPQNLSIIEVYCCLAFSIGTYLVSGMLHDM